MFINTAIILKHDSSCYIIFLVLIIRTYMPCHTFSLPSQDILKKGCAFFHHWIVKLIRCKLNIETISKSNYTILWTIKYNCVHLMFRHFNHIPRLEKNVISKSKQDLKELHCYCFIFTIQCIYVNHITKHLRPQRTKLWTK